MPKRSVALALFFLFFAVPFSSRAEDPPEPKLRTQRRGAMVLVGGGIGFGFFYPKDVNDFISREQEGTITTSGFSDMVLNITPRVVVDLAFIEYVQLQIQAEMGWGPKILTVTGGSTDFYNFNRYAAGGVLNAHIPIKQFRRSLFFGAGASYNRLTFEDYETDALGLRGQAGLRFYFGDKRFVPEVFLAFDWVTGESQEISSNAEIPDPYGDSNEYATVTDRIELNYTSLIIGGNFYFGALL